MTRIIAIDPALPGAEGCAVFDMETGTATHENSDFWKYNPDNGERTAAKLKALGMPYGLSPDRGFPVPLRQYLRELNDDISFFYPPFKFTCVPRSAKGRKRKVHRKGHVHVYAAYAPMRIHGTVTGRVSSARPNHSAGPSEAV